MEYAWCDDVGRKLCNQPNENRTTVEKAERAFNEVVSKCKRLISADIHFNSKASVINSLKVN